MAKVEKVEQIPETEVLETTPETNGQAITPVEQTGISVDYLKHLDYVANHIEKFVEAKQKIWQAILKLSKDGDWVVFEAKDGEGNVKASVCLTGAGADRIASSLGISFTNWKSYRENGEDEKGMFYRWWFEADASFGGRTIRVMGRAGSRDKFFGMAYGKLREISDIDESNIKMAAFHNCMKEGVKVLLGLRNIPKEEFKKAGISLTYARKVQFSSPLTQQSPTKQKQNGFQDMLEKFKKAKEALGDEKYYEILHFWGYKHANQIKTLQKMQAILSQMREAAKEEKKIPEED